MSHDNAHVVCSGCGRKYNWSANLAGKKVRCKCSAVIHVPLEAQRPVESGVNMAAAGDDPYDVALPPEPSSPRPAAPSAMAAAAPTAAAASCPSCQANIKPGAVICVNCGFNLQEGRKLQTEIGGPVRATTGQRAAPKLGRTDHYVDGYFGSLSRSWQFAKISYGIIWDFKQLLVFPILSGIASIVVLASFIMPLWGAGTLETFNAATGDNPTEKMEPWMWAVLFAFYYCSYFVIVFFNTALIASAMKVIDGEAPTVGYGLSIATKRLPQIAAWALVSALVGIVLKVIENSNEKVGKFISAVLGTGWTVLTFFVVPVLAVDGVGPIQAIKTSVATLRRTWGMAVMGNFSMGLLSFLFMLPLFGVFALLYFLAASTGSGALVLAVLILGFVTITLAIAASSAADIIFKALLFNYATGRSLPADVDESLFPAAFALPVK